MDVKRFFKNINLQSLLLTLALSSLSTNAFSASLPSARPATHADISHASPSVTSSNPSVATATITGTPFIPGVHTLTITQLAQAASVASSNFYPNAEIALGLSETLTITAGYTQIKVDVTATDSLKEIANKINDAAITAHQNSVAYPVATGPNQYQFVIGSTQTGVANAVEIVEISESGTPWNILRMDKILTAGQDSLFTLDYLAFQTASNNNIIGEWLEINFNGTGQTTLTVNET